MSDLVAAGKAALSLAATAKKLFNGRQETKLKDALRALYNQEATDEQFEALEQQLIEDPRTGDWLQTLFLEEDVAKAWAYGLVLRAYRTGAVTDLMAWAQFIRDVRQGDLDVLRSRAKDLLELANQETDQMQRFNEYVADLQVVSPRLINALIAAGFFLVERRPPVDLDKMFDAMITTRDFTGLGKLEMGDWKRPSPRLAQLLRILDFT